jgi:Cytochrome c oxidase subunit IV
MRVEAIFMLGIGVFFGIVGIVYWFTSYEDAGFLMLIGTTGLGLLPGAYYFWWSRHMKPRPEDNPNATMKDSSGVVDSFPNSSIWPFILGMGAFMVALAFVFGIWLAPIAGALIISAVIGATVESRRGGAI